MGKSSSFKDKVAADSQRQKSQSRSYGYLLVPKGVEIYKEEEGRRLLDILPYLISDEKHRDRKDDREIAIPGSLWYKKPFCIHRNIGSEGDAIICPTSFGLPCPICKHRSMRRKEGAEQNELKALRKSERNLYCVVPLGSKKYEEEPHIWDISQFGFQDELNAEIEEDPEYGRFAELEDGLTLRCRFTKEMIGKNEFIKCSRIDFEKRDQDYNEKILKKVPDLDKCLLLLSYKEIEVKFFEEEPVDEDEDHPRHHHKKDKDDDEDEQPRKHHRDEDEDDDDKPRHKSKDDDKDDEKPHRKSRDEDDDEPVRRRKKDDDDDDKPARKSKDDDDENAEKEKARRDRQKRLRDEDDDDKPNRKSKDEDDDDRPSKKSSKGEGGKCPYGHVFGKDCDKPEFHKDCDKCDDWDACYDKA